MPVLAISRHSVDRCGAGFAQLAAIASTVPPIPETMLLRQILFHWAVSGLTSRHFQNR